jgi:hypothetical protein
MHSKLQWNNAPNLIEDNGYSVKLNSLNPTGIIDGKHVGLPIAAGYVLKAGTPLIKVGAVLSPAINFTDTVKLQFNADMVNTTGGTSVISLHIGGLVITSTPSTLTRQDVITALKNTYSGVVGAALLASLGDTTPSIANITGTLGAFGVLTDSTNYSVKFVSLSYGVNSADPILTLTGATLSSFITVTSLANNANDKIVGILATDINTLAGSTDAPVYIELEAYTSALTLFAEPDEDYLVDGARLSYLSTGLWSFDTLQLSTLNSELNFYKAIVTPTMPT